MLQEANGDQAMSRAGVFEWHRRFREGEEDKPRSGKHQAMAQSRLAETEQSASVKPSNQSDTDCIF